MADDFLKDFGGDLRRHGLEPVDRDSQAKLWLLRSKNGGHIALFIKGESVRYWGLRVCVFERALARSKELTGLRIVAVFRAGDEGYVLSGEDIDPARRSWPTDRKVEEYKLTDSHLSRFTDFRGSAR